MLSRGLSRPLLSAATVPAASVAAHRLTGAAGRSRGMAQLASRFAVIGAGRMAEAMLGGMMKHRMQLYEKQWGVTTHDTAAKCVKDSDVVLLSVKPQHMPAVLADIAPSLPKTSLVVSIAAGCPISMFVDGLPTNAVVRSMPNTPAMVSEGMTVWTATRACCERQREQARTLLSCFGDELYVDDENYLDVATAIVGSGPAYTFMFMEAMVDTGVHMGFPREVAEKLVMKTVQGSVAYAQQSDKHIAALRNDITSPGGTTAASIYTADRMGFRTAIADSIWAAYRRSLELGGKDSNVGPGRSKQ
eukprot:TRINITY_DN23442_c0_g1_i1.p1 TRINITY_DN23442_c0_g1~~TRINITY_DN23442_c0_g1_i1.p1  ORF type:complete len:303 (+),score=69.18 TRINITY_DN23442_c0_g1_i1:52-960(+)